MPKHDPDTCRVPGCTRPAAQRGVCNTCYYHRAALTDRGRSVRAAMLPSKRAGRRASGTAAPGRDETRGTAAPGRVQLRTPGDQSAPPDYRLQLAAAAVARTAAILGAGPVESLDVLTGRLVRVGDHLFYIAGDGSIRAMDPAKMLAC